MGRRFSLTHAISHPPRQFFAEGDVSLPGELDKAVGEIGIVCGKRGFDIPGDDGLVVLQSRIELEVGENSRIVLRRQNGAGVARVRPQHGERNPAYRHDSQCRTEPRPFHPEKPSVFTSMKIVCRFSDTTAPTKEGLLWDDKIVSNLP